MDNPESKEAVTTTPADAPSPVTDAKPEANAGLPGYDLGGTDMAQQKEAVTGFFKAHPTGFWFFFWGEFAERCSYYGMRAILAKYMADELHLGQANAGTYMSFFIAACYFLPLVGGWVADNFFGKYWTIVGFSIPYILGHVILGYESFTFLVIALSLLAMGSGVIKPNISTLMGLTYDQYRPGQTQLRSDAFAIFYFSINIGAAISQFAMPPIRSAYGYWVAFLFPAGLMVIAFAIFAAGKPYYAREIITRVPPSPEERRQRWAVLRQIFALFVLVMFFWAIFDQSASTWIFFANDCMDLTMFGLSVDPDQIQAFNPVFILVLLPLITLLFKWLDRRGIKVRATDKMVLGFLLTAACMGIMALAALLAGRADLRPGSVEGDEVSVKVGGATPVSITGKLSVAVDGTDAVVIKGENMKVLVDGKSVAVKKGVKLTADKEIKLVESDDNLAVEGAEKVVNLDDKKTLAEGTLPATISGFQKDKVDKRWFVSPEKKVSVWWQVLAYLIITIAEVLISVTGLELAYTAAPKSMTGFVTACWLLTVGMANLLINARVTRSYTAMQPMTYFFSLALTLLVVTAAFFFVAKRFNRYAEEKANLPAIDTTRAPQPGGAGGSEGVTDPHRIQ